MDGQALVLNASDEALCVVSGRRALVLLLTDKAVGVLGSDEVAHSARAEVVVPVVVAHRADCRMGPVAGVASARVP